MDSQIIADFAAEVNSNHKGKVEIFDVGAVRFRPKGVIPFRGGGGKRGKITTFSAASARRLRYALVSLYVPGQDCLEICLTMPGDGLDETTKRSRRPAAVCPDGCAVDERRERMEVCFRKAWTRTRKAIERLGIAGEWRIELQRRGAPHLHLLLWFPQLRLNARVCEAWLEACDDCGWGDYDHFAHATYGYQYKVPNRHAVINYMTDHMSKHKREQLGWQGRQWGFINKRLLVKRPCIEVRTGAFGEVSWFDVQMQRIVGHLRRYRVRDSRCPFGWRKTKYRPWMVGTTLTHCVGTMEALAKWLLSIPPEKRWGVNNER